MTWLNASANSAFILKDGAHQLTADAGDCDQNLFVAKLAFCRVTELEAQKRAETKEEREAFRSKLREEVERQAREKHLDLKLPPDK